LVGFEHDYTDLVLSIDSAGGPESSAASMIKLCVLAMSLLFFLHALGILEQNLRLQPLTCAMNTLLLVGTILVSC
jgi:hypothetical protein